MAPRHILGVLALPLCLLTSGFAQTPPGSFINFETAPLHPLAVSPDGALLAVCNLPDGRVEVFDLSTREPTHLSSIPAGVDPVTVRFRNESEIWIVNQISDSILIADARAARITGLIQTRDAPADVVFAGDPIRAFVSCSTEDVVLVFDPETKTLLRTVLIEGERPKAMAVSPDGRKVYVAIFESGNGTTILAPRITDLGHVPAAGPVDLPIGPYGGLNPPPNLGTNLFPALNAAALSSNDPPRVSLIVKRQPDGTWLDDNNADWTKFISGTNAPFSGRAEGWDLIDHDVAVIDTETFDISFVEGLMNICMDVAVNPATGHFAVVGTDGINHVRFEPVLQSIFTRINLALIDPAEPATPRVLDLNPHLTYEARQLPIAERRASIGDPRGVLWNSEGTRLYVAGMGSDNLVMLDAEGARLAPPVPLPEGPTGIALDASRNHLFVLNRFGSSLSVLDADTLEIHYELPLHDPTPESIRAGRRHFYNTHETSGLGQASCASCHIDGRMDRLAWDLGNPLGLMKELTSTTHNFGGVPPALTNHFHPMKGPMVTQTLQDIIDHEPFHWRGDRDSIEEFNPTFEELQGAEELTEAEMEEFRSFLQSIHFPPNRFRLPDNSLPRDLPLPGHLALGRGTRAKGEPLPNGNAASGLNLFRSPSFTCSECHSLPSGLGSGQVFFNGRWTAISPGPNRERHIALSATERSHELPFKIPQLRNLPDKTGLNLAGVSRTGFGFFHDGSVDSLTRFLQDGFLITDDQQTADLIAFLLSFSGSDLPTEFSPFNRSIVPGDFSRDAEAAMGRQLLLSTASPELTAFMVRAADSRGRVDLVVKGRILENWRGWLFNGSTFLPDAQGTAANLNSLFELAGPGNPLLFTLVSRGTGRRLGIDRDEDGQLDFDEISSGSDPADPLPATMESDFRILSVSPISGDDLRIVWRGPPNSRYRIQFKETPTDPVWSTLDFEEQHSEMALMTNLVPAGGSSSVRFYRIERVEP